VHTPAERGEPLKAGDVLLAGALGPVVTLTPGDTVETRIQGIGSCSFTYGDEV
jgi:2-keto-4-pentenoate hydratase